MTDEITRDKEHVQLRTHVLHLSEHYLKELLRWVTEHAAQWSVIIAHKLFQAGHVLQGRCIGLAVVEVRHIWVVIGFSMHV